MLLVVPCIGAILLSMAGAIMNMPEVPAAIRGVGAGIHYPVPVHLQGAFAHLGHKEGDFPVSERAAKEILSLPMFPEITPAQQEEVVGALRAAL